MLRYDGVAFLSTPTPAGIHSIVIDARRAATQKGVDPLGESCSAVHCSGRLAHDRSIWFGTDPLEIIALSPTPME